MKKPRVTLQAPPARAPREQGRLYITGLPGVAPEERAWVFAQTDYPDGWGVKVKGRGVVGRARIDVALRAALLVALHRQEQLPPPAEPVDWDTLRALATPAPATPNPALHAGGAAAGPPPARDHALRAAQAASLVVADITSPGPVTIALGAGVPAALVERLARHPAVRLQPDLTLRGGELLLNDRLVVARLECTASPGEFSSSLLAGRLFRQVEALALSERAGILLLEGDLYAHSPGLPLLEQIDAFLAYSLACMRLSVLQTYSLNHSAYLLVKCAVHDRYGLAQRPAVHGPRPAQLAVARRELLMRLPGVTWAVADRLLRRFGSLATVAAADQEALLAVDGLGPATVKALRQVFQAREADG